ncbi:hypothetical protein HMPREF0880_04039 [Yokenella regensburgei ATCC 43003]|jgi:hypothetical protein|nr:hypothetical protein HMPREF0880_04039 [Yokenella regensburgei ATCC 43003]
MQGLPVHKINAVEKFAIGDRVLIIRKKVRKGRQVKIPLK